MPVWPDLPSHVTSVQVGRTEVLVDRRSGRSLLANGSASFVLRHRQLFRSREEAACLLSETFSRSEPELTRDLSAFEDRLGLFLCADSRVRGPMIRGRPLVGTPARIPRGEARHYDLEVLGSHVRVSSYSSTLDRHLAAVLAPMQKPSATTSPAPYHLHTWLADGRMRIARRGILVGTPGDVASGINRMVSLITAFAIDHHDTGTLLHAAGVIVNGRSVVMAGSSNQGKSSTTLELLTRDSAGYISDEVIELEPGCGRLKGLPRPIALEGGVQRDFESLRPEWADFESGQSRWQVDPVGLGDVVTSTCGGAILVFLQFDRSSGYAIRQLDPAETFSRLLRHLFAPSKLSDKGLDGLARIAEGWPAFLVTHAGSRAARAAVLSVVSQVERRGP